MRTLGVICEYNPFHRGHAYQLSRARQASGADFVLCVMSGCFTQRGEPALLSPHLRARMALENGADIVLELPALYAVRCAQQFALGGVSILSRLGVRWLSFGCEIDDPDRLWAWSRQLSGEDEMFRAALKKQLKSGQSYPSARTEALNAVSADPPPNLPNLSLALEYLSAIQKTGCAMDILPILRQGEGHHSGSLTSSFASAGALRSGLSRGETESIRTVMPGNAYTQLREAMDAGSYVTPDALDQVILYAVRRRESESLRTLLDMTEGLENRFSQAARISSTREETLEAVKTKRYPYARLSRLLCYALLDIPGALAAAYPDPPYVRLLGMRKVAGPLLRSLHRRQTLPIITKPSDSRLEGHPVFALEARAWDIWSLGLKNPSLRSGGRIYTQSPVILG